MRLTLLIASSGLALAALCVAPGAVQAEQIRLSDGRYLQGKVVKDSINEDGFTFKLTDGGGKVFLRWTQVDAGLKTRLRNEKDPDAGLNLSVTVDGARLELVDGTVHQGQIVRNGNVYVVTNRSRRVQVPVEDVAEEGFITGIQIEATVMMSEREALAKAEEQRAPLDTALKYYEIARIADKLGLYEEAKEYVAGALQAGPDARLQARLTEYEARLVELIRLKEFTVDLSAARVLAKDNKYQLAINLLKETKDKHKPADEALAKWEEVAADVEFGYFEFVISEWYRMMKPVVQAKLKEKESRDMTIAQAMNWARREMDEAIQQRISQQVGATVDSGIRTRFMQRHALADAEAMKTVVLPLLGKPIGDVASLSGLRPIKLTTRKASFREDGFYTIVQGHLPVAGRQPRPAEGQPGNNQPGGRRMPRQPGGDGNQGSQTPRDWSSPENGFQQQPRTPSEEEIRKAAEDARAKAAEAGAGARKDDVTGKNPAAPDISGLKIPAVVPSMNEWWEKSSRGTRTDWLIAFYVKTSGTMRIMEYDKNSPWDIRYR